jgi:hypothetical protein
MRKHTISTIAAGAAGVGAMVIVLAADRALAAGECLDRPTHDGHWYSRFDPVKQRKCWYLVDQSAAAPTARTAPQQPEPSPSPSLLSFFDSLRTGFIGANPPATDADAKRPAAADHPKPKKHIQQASHPPSVEPAAEASEAPLTETERQVLFQQFLEWRAQHLTQ